MKEDMALQTFGQRQKLFEWSKRVADCRQSGLSVKRWCSENGVTIRTYYNWQKKVLEAMVKQQQIQLEVGGSVSEGSFVELPSNQVRQEVPEVVAAVRIGNDTVEFYSGASPAVVTAICRGMKEC